ncbi:hypothetical protein [Clostridium pasteurianum]|uniref:hypothetical protein n=1 Tax=Clostridium pasteurianum TaxID=1501 RepID=UPI001FA8308E|nr:hypothetical protein [Clostridium pasteurianum]
MNKKVKSLNHLKNITVDASKITAKKFIDASENAKDNLQKNLNDLKDASKSTAEKVKTVSKNAKKTITKTSEDIAKKSQYKIYKGKYRASFKQI